MIPSHIWNEKLLEEKTVKIDLGSIFVKDGAERNSCRPTFSHLFQVMKKGAQLFCRALG